MTKKEMAAWYWAICEAMKDCPAPGEWSDQEGLDSWDSFFMEWARQLFVEAGRPKGFPWRVDE
jgi:hypothetical protein